MIIVPFIVNNLWKFSCSKNYFLRPKLLQNLTSFPNRTLCEFLHSNIMAYVYQRTVSLNSWIQNSSKLSSKTVKVEKLKGNKSKLKVACVIFFPRFFAISRRHLSLADFFLQHCVVGMAISSRYLSSFLRAKETAPEFRAVQKPSQ